MGKLQEYQVLFEGGVDVFKPGDLVKGNVRILLSGEKGDIRGIKVKCKGSAYTHWTESRSSGSGRNRRSRTIHYSWDVVYFKQEVILRGAGKDNKMASRMQLPAGDHHFPFQFQLPNTHMPPPFEGTVGYVRYFIKATIDRPWKFDHKTTQFFTILAAKDLNAIPEALNIPSSRNEKTVCCLCCESGPIRLRASIDKTGYVPGESILFTLELDNQSGREIASLVASLHQNAIYRANHGGSTHIRKSSHRVTELRFEGSNVEGAMTMSRKPMLIPPIPPNTFHINCPNIDVFYIVKIQCDISGTPVDLTIEFPVIIGTIPALPRLVQAPRYQAQPAPGYHPQPASGYQPQPAPGYQPHPAQAPHQQYQPRYPPPQGASYQPSYSAPPGQPPPSYPVPHGAAAYAPPPSAPMLPPPSYEMAAGGPKEIPGKDGTHSTTMYAPRYPYYNPQALGWNMEQQPGTSGQGQAPIVSQPQPQQQVQYQPYQPAQVNPEEIALTEYPAM